MRTACLLLLFSALLPAQNIKWIAGYSGDIFKGQKILPGTIAVTTYISYAIDITEDLDTGAKYFNLQAEKCTVTTPEPQPEFSPTGPGKLVWPPPTTVCTKISYANAITLSEIQAALSFFYNLAPGKVPHIINYTSFGGNPPNPPPYSIDLAGAAPPYNPDLTTLAPNAPADPQMIYLDELSTNTVVNLDLTTGATLAQVTLPNSAQGPFGIRPNPSGPPTEVWVANGDTQISIGDLASQSVAATLPITGVPVSATSAGIVFSNDGAAAYEALAYSSPDPEGNNGALLVFDAANRAFDFWLPLKYAPSALLMAPDGLTAYLLSSSGMLTYFDVVSGTADLTLSTYTAGMSGGYPGAASQVFVTPDGTRLLWNVGVDLSIFDLNTHTVIALIDSGLPTTTQASMQMTQDGAQVWFTDAQGDVAVLDAHSGFVVGSMQNAMGPQLLLPSPTN